MRSDPTPTPGVFGQRVWICLIAKELTLLATTKSPQQYVRKGLRDLLNAEACLPGGTGAETVEFGIGCEPKQHRATQIVIKTKELLKKGFVSVWRQRICKSMPGEGQFISV